MANLPHSASNELYRQKWLSSERYFARSWTHIFYRWKYHRVMVGQVVQAILSASGLKEPLVLELGCGVGNGIRNRFVSGCLIALDPIMDRLPGCYLLSTSLGMLCRRHKDP